MKTLFRADLHCHTDCSDGSLSPQELIKLAKQIGLSALSITDHDSIAAYATASAMAQEEGVLLGAGVEFSSQNEGINVHVLGYDIDINNLSLQEFCERHVQRRKERNFRILEKLNRLGMPLDVVDIEEQGKSIGRPHIALAMVKKGYVASVSEAFHRFIGDRCPCFDPGKGMTTDETISIIHQAGGKAFIAHPHLLRDQKLVVKLLQKPFDGIECYYARFGLDMEKKWIKIAEDRNLLISGGSDFHGSVKPENPLGSSWVDESAFRKIFEKNVW